MGSSGESNTKSIDASVGGLVWVRRRNGSWWPGRIVGLDELPESCVISPKSGTPVKLLGRNDASVDWYNLEKSKRVKAFRCGEYDECIRKAKASAVSPNKKAVKYARREDAILHALEIESSLLPKDHPDFFFKSENADGEDHVSRAVESTTMSHTSEENEDMADEVSTFEDTSNSTQELSQSGLSFEEPNQNSTSKLQPLQGKRRKTPNDSEDDGTEGIKRMRGLQDLGMGVVTKKRPQAGGDIDIVQQGSSSPSDSNTANSLFIGSHGIGSNLRNKKPQVANAYEFFKRKNRRRPLMKVLESTTMVSVPVMCDEHAGPCLSPVQGFPENKISGLVINSLESTSISCGNGVPSNATEADGCDASHVHPKIDDNEILSILDVPQNGSSDALFDVPFVRIEKHSAGFSPMYSPSSSGKAQAGSTKRQSSQSSQAESASLKSDGPIESGSTGSAGAYINNNSQSMEKGTSKWKSKGKRKSRYSNKNYKKGSGKFVDMAGMEHPEDFSTDSGSRVDCGVVNGPPILESCTLQAKSRESSKDPVEGFHVISSRKPHIGGTKEKLLLDCSMGPQKLLPYRQSRYTVHPKYQTADFPTRNYGADSLLYDVNLEVKASYRPQHVPLVSLMSKLNGKAIVGHPLTVEVLADGSSDCPIVGGRFCSSHNALNGGLSIAEAAGMGLAAKTNEDMRRCSTKQASLQKCFSPIKSPKSRKCGIMSKKTRKLSSLTGLQMRSKEEEKLMVEKPKGPVIACVPLKVVFSRLNEAVNGSTRPAHGC